MYRPLLLFSPHTQGNPRMPPVAPGLWRVAIYPKAIDSTGCKDTAPALGLSGVDRPREGRFPQCRHL